MTIVKTLTKVIILEAPIPDQDPIGNLLGTKILIRLRVYFNQAITNNVNTHVLVLSVKVRRNEKLKHHTLINHALHILTYGDNKCHVDN